ncbi:MAG TPA: hypothetical protein VEU30_07515 [Thermoanaerobaculia bacterium]|nr:hypothetical protein [Thermoanaerobaculia bacterium]
MLTALVLAAVCTLQFDAPRAYEARSAVGAQRVEAADLDGDGFDDAVVSEQDAFLRTAGRRVSAPRWNCRRTTRCRWT